MNSPKHGVEATVHFYNPPQDGSMPTFTVTDPSGAGLKNYGHDPNKIFIRDMRGRESAFSLSVHAFAPVSNVYAESIDFGNPDEVERKYTLVVDQIIRRQLPATRKIVVFDSAIRKATPDETLCRPVRKAHVDQSPAGACQRMERHLSQDEAGEVEERRLRARIINVWKPLVRAVRDHPLAVAESCSVDEGDLVPVKHIYPDRTGETLAVRYNKNQRFWYWRDMTPNEALLLVCYDSRPPSGCASGVRCAHASFTLQEQNFDRQSIEVRCIVLEGWEGD
jgi:hypothetical protein